MKVILKEEVKGLGQIGTVVDVKNGYGRNYLIPRDLAAEANSRNIKEFEHQKNTMLARAKKVKGVADDLAGKISALSLSFEVQAGEEDKLFGSITSKDIAGLIAEKGFDVDKRKVVLDEPIKRLGSYEVQIKMQQDVTATVKVEVTKAVSEEE